MHICFDWDGTLAKIDVAYEAAIRRSKTLGEQFDSKWLAEAMKTDSHYAVNKKLIRDYTGVSEKRLQTEIMTNLFQYHYLGVANELKKEVLFDGIYDMITKLNDQGHKLSIATTLRKDIVVPVLKNLELYKQFSYVAGNNATLDYNKEELLQQVIDEVGLVEFMVGDKSDDVDAGHVKGAKGVLVSWGSHKNYDKADKTFDTSSQLYEFLSKPL